MNEEVVLELTSQKVIQFLISNPKFIEKWQKETRKNLEKQQQRKYKDDEGIDLKKPSTSTTPSINKATELSVISIQTTVQELTSTIQYVIDIFEDNVDPRNCLLSDRATPNKNMNSIYDAGQKVDKLRILEMDRKELREKNGNQIGSACRRLSLELKRFGRQFQGLPSLEVKPLLPIIHRFSRLFYAISHEIYRFSEGFKSRNRKLLKNIGSTVEKLANEFNLKVAAEIETIITSLESSRKFPKSRPNSVTKTQPLPTQLSTDYDIQTQRQARLATSIQQVIGRARGNVTDREIGNGKFKKTHKAGSIATSIIPFRRGFLIEDNLMKARQRIANSNRHHPKMTTLNIDKSSPVSLENSDESIMKSARKLTELVLDDVRNTINL